MSLTSFSADFINLAGNRASYKPETNVRQDKLDRRDLAQFNGILVVNRSTIDNRETLLVAIGKENYINENKECCERIVYDEVNKTDYIVNTVITLLNRAKSSKYVWHDNLSLPFNKLEIDCKVKYSTPIKPQIHVGKTKLSPIKTPKKVGEIIYYDPCDPDFEIDHLYSVTAYDNQGNQFKLFSTIGKLEVDPDKIYQKLKVKSYDNVNLSGTNTFPVVLNTHNLTSLRYQTQVDSLESLQCLATVWHNGLIDLTLGNYTYHIAAIGLSKEQTYQYVDVSDIKIAQYLNLDTGVSKSSQGTFTLDKTKYSFKYIDAILSKLYANHYKVYSKGDFVFVSVNGKDRVLCKRVDTGYKRIPKLFRLFDGSLPSSEVTDINRQLSVTLGRYLKKVCNDSVNKAAIKGDKNTQKQCKQCIALLLAYDNSLSLTDDNRQADKIISALQSQSINVDPYLRYETAMLSYEYHNGLDATRDLIIKCRKALLSNDYQSQSVITFRNFMMK